MASTGQYAIICISIQTDNNASTSPLSFYRPDALPAAQPTAWKHCFLLNWKLKRTWLYYYTISQYYIHRCSLLLQTEQYGLSVSQRYLANTTEQSMYSGDAACCQITLTICYYYYNCHHRQKCSYLSDWNFKIKTVASTCISSSLMACFVFAAYDTI